MMMSGDDAGTSGVRRLEVFRGMGKRRESSPEAKAAIVAESYSGLESVSAVARRHGLATWQLFGWRRQLDTSKNVLNFCIEACWVRRGSARRVVAV